MHSKTEIYVLVFNTSLFSRSCKSAVSFEPMVQFKNLRDLVCAESVQHSLSYGWLHYLKQFGLFGVVKAAGERCYLIHTLRSWLQNFLTRVSTWSHGLEKNYTFQFSSNNFPSKFYCIEFLQFKGQGPNYC